MLAEEEAASTNKNRQNLLAVLRSRESGQCLLQTRQICVSLTGAIAICYRGFVRLHVSITSGHCQNLRTSRIPFAN